MDYSRAATLSVPQLPLTDPGRLGPSAKSSRVPRLFPSSWKQGPASAAFRCPLLSSLGRESLSRGGMEEKVESTTPPDGPCVVSVQETEKWMEEAMRMVRNPAGGC